MKFFQSALLILIALAAPIVARAATATNSTASACCASAAEGAEFSDRSIYQVVSKWKNDAGKEVSLHDFRGRPQVIVMFFASCNYACPLLVNDLRRIESALPENVRGNVSFTLVSFDTKRDTPEALAQFRQGQNFPVKNWNLLSGSADDVLELAALLGVRYKEDATGQFMHSNLITILNAEGEIVHQQTGLNQNVDASVRILKQLATL